MTMNRKQRRFMRKFAPSSQMTPKEILCDVDDPRVQRLLDDVTVVFTRAMPPTPGWLDRVNAGLELFKLGAIVAAAVKDRDDLIALTWGMTLRGKEAADVKWGVGLPPIRTASRKELVEKDPANPVSPFAQVCTVVVSKAPEAKAETPETP